MGQNNELQLLPPPSRPAPRSAFAAHGIWAPGVLLMRRINFQAKALIITAIFLIPVLVASIGLFRAQWGQIQFSEKEIVGAQYLRETVPLQLLLQDVRRLHVQWATTGQEPAEWGAARAALSQQLEKLQAVESQLGAELGSAQAHARLRSAATAERAAPTGQTVLQIVQQHQPAMDGLVGLIDSVLDTSNLILDPDIDTYFLMDGALTRLPLLSETTSRISAKIGGSLARGTEIDVEMAKSMSSDEAIGDFMDGALSTAVGKVVGIHPDLLSTIDPKPAIAKMHGLHEAVEAVESGEGTVTAAEVWAAGASATRDFARLQMAMVVELERLLEIRVREKRTLMVIESVVISFTVLLAAYLFYCFYLVTRGGLRLISQHLQEMADGDLRRAPAQPWGSDEPAQVIVDLRKAYDSLHLLIRRVRHSARELTGTSVEIANSSLDLSARTEAAAASLEEQAAAMEQIGSQVADSAQRAQDAAAFSEENARVADKSRTVVNTVVGTMRDIQQSSSKIGDIIGVIDGIAFQTNILALNAAVEAARAGDAGRGFAVVAAEVRSLAQRSAEAAREIKGLITNSVAKVESGVSVVEQAGATMATLVSNAEQINQSVMQIAMGAREQASGVEQVGQAIQTLDSNTQQNAALVEETSAAAAVLKEQAELLQQQIANFRFS